MDITLLKKIKLFSFRSIPICFTFSKFTFTDIQKFLGYVFKLRSKIGLERFFNFNCGTPIDSFDNAIFNSFQTDPCFSLLSKSSIYFNFFSFLKEGDFYIASKDLYTAWTWQKTLYSSVFNSSNGSRLRLRLTSYARRAMFYKNKKMLLVRSGHSYTDRFVIPRGIYFRLYKKRTFVMYSFNFQKLCNFGRTLFNLKPADPYKGGGVRYIGRHIKLKKHRVKF